MPHMKQTILLLALVCSACGREASSERCRSPEEAQMSCQLDYVETYRLNQIPEWIKSECMNLYPGPTCYLKSSDRHHWKKKQNSQN